MKELAFVECQASYIHYFIHISTIALVDGLDDPHFADGKIKAQGDERACPGRVPRSAVFLPQSAAMEHSHFPEIEAKRTFPEKFSCLRISHKNSRQIHP